MKTAMIMLVGAALLGGCAGMPDEAPPSTTQAPDVAAGSELGDAAVAENPVVRIETGVGTILVRQHEAEPMEQLLAGEVVGRRYMAVSLLAAE